MARILVVDDDPHVGKVFAKALQRAGYEAEVVTCGAAALQRIAEQSFSLVVLDLSMPAPDGFEVLRALKRMESVRPPVVMVSGSMGDDLLKAAEFLGAVASVPKSAGTRRLVAVVANILGAPDRP